MVEQAVAVRNTDYIDVVEEFCYDSRNAQYNHDYHLWRKNTKSRFLYRCSQNKKEHSYMEGTGFASTDVAIIERNTLQRVSELLGLALLCFLICFLLCGSFLIWALQQLGMDIHLDFLTLTMGGSQWLVVGVRTLVVLVQYGSALLLLNHFFRLPTRVRVPFSLRAFPETVAAIGGAMLCAAVYCIPDYALNSGAEAAQQLFSYKDTLAVTTYGLFDAVVVSILSELLLRGTLLPVLRQFGDRFAVLTVAGVAFLLPNALPARLGECCVGMVSGYLLVKGGSFHNCVILRAVYAALIYARLSLVYQDDASLSIGGYLLILLAGFGLSSLLYWLERKNHLRFTNRDTYLPSGKKLLIFFETMTMLPWLAISLIFALIQLVC